MIDGPDLTPEQEDALERAWEAMLRRREEERGRREHDPEGYVEFDSQGQPQPRSAAVYRYDVYFRDEYRATVEIDGDNWRVTGPGADEFTHTVEYYAKQCATGEQLAAQIARLRGHWHSQKAAGERGA